MRWGLVVPSALAGVAVAAPAAPAESPPAPETVTAIATAQVRVARPAHLDDKTIAAAIGRARTQLAPEALRLVRREAVSLGYAAGVRVGRLLSLADVASGPFGPFNYGAEGTFGPGRYCGRVPTFRTRVVNGQRRRVRTGTRRTCRVPPFVTRTVSGTYAIDGPLAGR
jgi:hypothetical protein